mmetsp:Transcript_24540/g.31214  ORF Transcript_24540/g.31214 Transcript_24540/m.31214 type:complete len:99 (+) Transcript_24540:52-348(+)
MDLLFISWVWEPCSAIFPSFRTTIVSAFFTVLNRCATINVVRSFIRVSSADCTAYSDAASRALVASSNTKILGFFTMARAMAILCFCPPDKVIPRSPI